MLDDMFDHLQSLRMQPVWQAPPADARARFKAPLPTDPTELSEVHAQFLSDILPYGGGNTHPGFMGWVQGGGTAVGMLADMLAAGLNANLGGRNHMPIQVERQIALWMCDVFGFPETGQGLFLTGASQANFVAVLLARQKAKSQVRLTAYASDAVHGCLPRAMDMAGIGAKHLRCIATNADGGINLSALSLAIEEDRAAGFMPFLLIGTAGTVNTGAVDDLDALADVAQKHDLHFHIDGALGALGVFSSELAPLFRGIEKADSLAFDFHKWGQVPYDAGFLLTRNGDAQAALFASEAAYLTRAKRGLAAGDLWPCDYGPDLSRGFRALKTWFTLKTFGLEALGASMASNCHLAQDLALRIDTEAELELMAPVRLNIVCFRYGNDDARTARIVEALHEAGRVAPSLTIVNGRNAIRAAIVNHRTKKADIDALVESVLALGRTL